MSLIFVFVDGLGLGRDDQCNPLFDTGYFVFSRLTGGQSFTKQVKKYRNRNLFFTPVDACMGVEGLPQSGTGQVTLFSGINSAQKLGRHFGPYPHSSIRDYLGKDSIFQKFQREKGSCHFINAFPNIFFEKANKKNRWSCTTLMTRMAGYPLNSVSEVLAEKAITAEITQSAWKNRLSMDVPEITEAEAADRVMEAAELHDLVLAEYYLTDKAGHNQDPDYAGEVLKKLDRFLIRIMDQIPASGHTLLLTSDHGNIEDLSTKSHTRNKVPFFVMGEGTEFFESIKSIQEVTPLSLRWFQSTSGQSR